MKISCEYRNFKLHSGITNGKRDLIFSKHELIHACYTVGKSNWLEVFSNPYFSIKEIEFRINMIQAFLTTQNNRVIRSRIFSKLDPSEKGAINYFLGMVFTNLVAQQIFRVDWLIHLDLFNGHVEFGENKKRPDFVADSNLFSWMAFESKGRQDIAKSVTDALDQLSNIESINGVHNNLKVASVLYGKVDELLQMKIVDPEEEGKLKINLDGYDYAAHYYAQIFNMIIGDTEIIDINNRKFAVRDIKCSNTRLGIDLTIFELLEEKYKIWDRIIDENHDRNIDLDFLEQETKGSIWVTKYAERYLKDVNEELNNKKSSEYFIGSDGVYVNYYGKYF